MLIINAIQPGKDISINAHHDSTGYLCMLVLVEGYHQPFKAQINSFYEGENSESICGMCVSSGHLPLHVPVCGHW